MQYFQGSLVKDSEFYRALPLNSSTFPPRGVPSPPPALEKWPPEAAGLFRMCCHLEPRDRPSFRSIEFGQFFCSMGSPLAALSTERGAAARSAEGAGEPRELSATELIRAKLELDANGFTVMESVAAAPAIGELRQQSAARLRMLVEGRAPCSTKTSGLRALGAVIACAQSFFVLLAELQTASAFLFYQFFARQLCFWFSVGLRPSPRVGRRAIVSCTRCRLDAPPARTAHSV